MKKILIVLVVIFIANLGCKKANVGGEILCACTVAGGPTLSLVIKNSTDVDLLSPATAGYFGKNQIQLYSKEANNVIRQISFDIRPPFTYGDNLKVNYYQLISSQITLLSKSIDNTFYLKLVDGKLYELNLKVNNNVIEKLFIDKTEAPREIQTSNNSYLDGIYRLKI
ncbi:hypothetical protein [Pedobacter sp. UBA5917]|jgi:hypothetical protein|uniref:hypothetical protein n=1 Tax=Pedobacter sp. UBA5917 TaxID=1947061 RepID=UPI0025CFF907|nr:hypothetical protein [Pedobacter sp. UBA5917]